MKRNFQIIIIIFLIFLVGILGFFAVKIATDSLIFPFYNQEKQEGEALNVIVDRSGSFSKILPANTLLDVDALKKSLFLNGKRISEEEIENFEIRTHAEGFVEILPKKMILGDILLLSSDEYNLHKKTSYRFPKDIELIFSDQEKFFTVWEKWLPKEKIFSLESLDFSRDELQKIKFFSYNSSGKCFENDILWDVTKMKEIPSKIEEIGEWEEKIFVNFHLDYVVKNQNCIVGGVSGKMIKILDRTLDDFVLKWENGKTFTENNILKSEAEFQSNSPLVDISDEKNIENFKKQILKKITISPSVQMTENDIEIGENFFRITADFQENKKYIFHFSDIEDIYGRQVSGSEAMEFYQNPFFSIEGDGNFSHPEDVSAKIFSIKNPQEQFSMKLCRLDLSGYFQLQEIISKRNKEQYDEIYKILHSENASQCEKADIVVRQNNSVTEISLKNFFQNLGSGLYIFSLRNQEDAENFENFIAPMLFSVTANKIIWTQGENNFSEFLVIDRENGVPQAHQEMEFSVKIGEHFNEKNNKYENFSTGIILWKTDENGFFRTNFSEILKNFSSKNQEKNIHAIVIARWEKWMTFAEGDLQIRNRKNISQLFVNKNEFFPGEKFFFTFQIEKNFQLQNFSDTPFEGLLMDSEWKIYKKFPFKIQDSEIFVADFDLPERVGNYVFGIKNLADNEFLTQKNIFINNTSTSIIDMVFRGVNLENDSPKDFRKITNQDEKTKYYDVIFVAPVTMEAIISAKNPENNLIKNSKFSYALYEKIGNKKEALVAEWYGNFDTEWMWYLRLQKEFQTFYYDGKYRLEISFFDIFSQKNISQSSEIIIKLPDEYKNFPDDEKIQIAFEKDIFVQDEKISGKLYFSELDDVKNLLEKYEYNIVDKNTGNSILSGGLQSDNFVFENEIFSSGEYEMQIFPSIEKKELLPENLISKKDFLVIKDENFEVKNFYAFYKNENISIFSPQENGRILLSVSDNDGIISEYFPISDGKIFKNISHLVKNKLDFSLSVQFFDEIGNVVFHSTEKIASQKENTDVSIVTNINKNKYFVDELQNIEIIAEKNIPIWVQISEKNHQKLIFSTEIMITNDEWKISFSLPELHANKNYILDIFVRWGNSEIIKKSQEFALQKEYSILGGFPKNAYFGDKMSGNFQVKNLSETISQAEMQIFLNHSSEPIFFRVVNMNLWLSEMMNFDVKIAENFEIGNNSYVVRLVKNNKILDEISGEIFVEEVPYIGLNKTKNGNFQNNEKIEISSPSFLDLHKSSVKMIFGENLAVILPELLDGMKNSKKYSIQENLQYFVLLSEIHRNLPEYNLVDEKQLIFDFHNWLAGENFENWQNSPDILDYLISLKKIQKFGIEIPEKWLQEENNYIAENLNFWLNNAENSVEKILQLAALQYLVNKKFDEEKIQNLDFEKFSQKEWEEYFSFLQITSQKIPEWVYEKIINNEDLIKINDLKKIEILLYNENFESVKQKFSEYLANKNLSLTTLEEKFLLTKIAILHAKNHKISPIKMNFSTETLRSEIVIDHKNPIHILEIPREKMIGNINLASSSEKEIFYSLSEKNFLHTPSLLSEKISENLKISSVVREILEEKWQTEDGKFRISRELEDNFLQKWKLYQFTTTVKILKESKNNVPLELYQFFPNAAEIFVEKNKNSHIIFQKNNLQILRLQTQKSQDEYEISYYFRSKKSGSYLLPANFVYFIDDKENVAHLPHQYFHIQ